MGTVICFLLFSAKYAIILPKDVTAMRRFLALLLAAVLLISLPGCGAVPEQPVQTLPHTLPTQAPTEPAEPQDKGGDGVKIAAIAGGSAVAVAGIGAYVFLKMKGLIK